MAEFGENIDMFDEVKQDLLVKQTLEWMTIDSNPGALVQLNQEKTDLLKLVVESSGIEKLGKELFNVTFFLANITFSSDLLLFMNSPILFEPHKQYNVFRVLICFLSKIFVTYITFKF